MSNHSDNSHFSPDTVFEIIRDLFCFEFILEIKRRMKNEEAKSYVVSFLKILAPVYVHELANAFNNLGLISKDELLTAGDKKQVNYERQLSMHKTIALSTDAQKALTDMGIEFNQKVYDINIVICNGKLYDLNFESQIASVHDFDFWNFLFNIPQTVLNGIFKTVSPDFSLEAFYHTIEIQMDSIAHKLDKTLSLSRYSYSAYRLFQNAHDLEESDKVLILYRYRMVTALGIMSSIFPNVSASIEGSRVIDMASFLRKYRAILICVLGDELQKLDTPFVRRIKADIQTYIKDDRFFRLNRRLRNNIHYEKTERISEDEEQIISKNQILYLSILERHFNSSINICIDKECETMTGFSRAYGASDVSREQLDRHYYDYYQKYLLTGKL